MSVNLHPLADYIVAQGDSVSDRTASGLFIPSNTQEKPKTATVLAIGPDVKQVKKGDRIIYKSYSTTDVKVEKADYILVKEEDVLATVK
ncbi:MAG: co-chaperone GroES [Candidatus Saccharibacteria bacterium]